jgi:stress response protein YsnF
MAFPISLTFILADAERSMSSEEKPTQPGSKPSTALVEGEGSIPLAEEVLHLSKQEVSTGKVRVHTLVDTEEKFVRETLEQRSVEVTRVPKNQVVDVVPTVRTENGVTIVPVLEEIVVVETKLVLKEEVHIRTNVSEDTVEFHVPLRKQRAVVERLDAEGQPITEEDKP